MSICWNFSSNNNEKISVISEAGIETFRGKQLKSLAREICQNSLDTIAESKDPFYALEYLKRDFSTKVLNLFSYNYTNNPKILVALAELEKENDIIIYRNHYLKIFKYFRWKHHFRFIGARGNCRKNKNILL